MKTLLLSSALSVVAASAMAQDMTYGNATFTYSSLSDGGDNLDTIGVAGQYGYQVDAFSFGITVDYLDFDTPGPSFSLSGLTVEGAYEFAPGWSAGAVYSALDIDGENLDFYEIFGLYDAGTFFGRLSYADGEDFLFGEEAGYGLTVGYDFGQGTEAAASLIFDSDDSDDRITILQVNHDAEMLEVDFTYFDVSGGGFNFFDLGVAYAVTPQVDVLFDYRDYEGDARTYAIGGSYEFADGVSAFAKYSQLDVGGDNVDGFSLGVTYDMGDKPLSQETIYDRAFRPLYFDMDGFPLIL